MILYQLLQLLSEVKRYKRKLFKPRTKKSVAGRHSMKSFRKSTLTGKKSSSRSPPPANKESSTIMPLRKKSASPPSSSRGRKAPVMPDRTFKLFEPPLLNSSSPWATSREQLQELYHCESTGAVTTRTALLDRGFKERSAKHQHAFFGGSSINSYGYSPRSLDYYLESIKKIVERPARIHNPPSSQNGSNGSNDDADTIATVPAGSGTASPSPSQTVPIPRPSQKKPFIVSVTGTSEEVRKAVFSVSSFAHFNLLDVRVEINLSCPNIPDKPPPSYSYASLKEYLVAIKTLIEVYNPPFPIVPIGVKVPPYTYNGQFFDLVGALEAFPGIVNFITSTNTLGNSLMMGFVEETTPTEAQSGNTEGNENDSGGEGSSSNNPAVTTPKEPELKSIIASPTGSGLGGLAGESIHPISLGNVYTLRRILNASKEESIRKIVIVGVGGVSDNAGYERMKKAGASVVGLATAFGRDGITVFEKIRNA